MVVGNCITKIKRISMVLLVFTQIQYLFFQDIKKL